MSVLKIAEELCAKNPDKSFEIRWHVPAFDEFDYAKHKRWILHKELLLLEHNLQYVDDKPHPFMISAGRLWVKRLTLSQDEARRIVNQALDRELRLMDELADSRAKSIEELRSRNDQH